MSSLAAARADNFYYPQGWEPKHGSINKFNNSNPLGNRVKPNGVLVVRFEIPFHCWCLHCNLHIGKGVRFNAKKKKVGYYHSTIIYEFSMNCTKCKNEMIIQTNPKDRTYDMKSGIKMKTDLNSMMFSKDSSIEDIEQMNQVRLERDPFETLEHENTHVTKPHIEQLIEYKQSIKDMNSTLRNTFRKKKKVLQKAKKIHDQRGLHLPTLTPNTAHDFELAKRVRFQKKVQNTRKKIAQSSIFSK